MTYIVVPVLEDDYNCLRSEFSSQDIEIIDQCPESRYVRMLMRTWVDDTTETVFDFTQRLTGRDLDLSYLDAQIKCSHWMPDVELEAGSNNNLQVCSNGKIGTSGSLSFNPPSIEQPIECTDFEWLYVVESTDMPEGFQVFIDRSGNQLSWKIDPFLSLGADLDPGSHEIIVHAFVPSKRHTMEKVEAFRFTLVIDCCAAPTLIKAPNIGQSLFEYMIGSPALDISVSGPYTSDSTCCGSP